MANEYSRPQFSMYIGATVWYACAVGGALMVYGDCLADCSSE